MQTTSFTRPYCIKNVFFDCLKIAKKSRGEPSEPDVFAHWCFQDFPFLGTEQLTTSSEHQPLRGMVLSGPSLALRSTTCVIRDICGRAKF